MPRNPLPGLFNLPGLPFTPWTCASVLPQQGCKQFHVAARIWYGKLNASTIVWGTNLGTGGEGTELDLHDDLDLGRHIYISEYMGRFQIRKNWGVRYTFMPIVSEEAAYVWRPGGFWFGYNFFPFGAPIRTKWERNIHRWDLIYDFIRLPHAAASLFAGYSLYDDKLWVSTTPNVRSIRSQGFGLAYAGGGIERAVTNLSGGATASFKCQASIQFLESYVGWDGYAAWRLSVPMNSGRYGYLEAGWRWIALQRDHPSNADKTSIDGLMGAAGIVF